MPTGNAIQTAVSSLALSGGVLTGNLELAAGTASAAPLTFQAGTNLTAATAGTEEFDGIALYFTSAGSSRQVVDTEQIQCLSANYTLANNTSPQALLNATAAGALTVQGLTTYEFDCAFILSSLPASAHTISFGIAGTAAFTSAMMLGIGVNGSGGTPALAYGTSVSAIGITPSAATTFAAGMIRGVLRVSTAGTVIPQVTQNTASAAAVVNAGAYFRAWPVGSNTFTSVGDWS